MSPVRGTVRELSEEAKSGTLPDRLAEWVGVRDPGASEYRSWQNSLPVLFKVLVNAGLGHVQVVLEHRLPYSPRRVDAVICGVRPGTGQPAYVLVELKQWSKAKKAGPCLVTFSEKQRQPVLHPAEQVRRYCRHLLDLTPDLARLPDSVNGIAYMHNARRDDSWDLDEFEYDDFGRLYTSDQTSRLTLQLRKLLEPAPESVDAAQQAADRLLAFRPAPARTLLKTAAAALANRDGFVLLDEQKVAFEIVREAVRNATAGTGAKKRVVVVRGGPGSGKSAIAMTLLAELAGQHGKVLHATGSRAFTETLRAVVRQPGENGDRVERVFTYFNEHGNVPQNSLDVLICDEAHRIRGLPPEASAVARKHVPDQIDELISAAKVPVFLMDDHQVIRPNEIGTPRHVFDVAHQKGCEVVEVDLEGQFRCGGSPLYDEWVRRLLGLSDQGPVAWSELVDGTDDEYALCATDSPEALESWLRKQARLLDGTARIAAGFCWPWSDPARQRDGAYRLADDIDIDGWRRPWNTKPGKTAPDDVPPASLWASDPKGFGQVGCIYTAQGFEYDWSGVIFGGDLVIRDGKWRARRDKSQDDSVKRARTHETFDRLTRNTYKVLLTRGMQGTCLYSTDKDTNEFFRKMTL